MYRHVHPPVTIVSSARTAGENESDIRTIFDEVEVILIP
jgi:hypothetical protein